MRLHFVYAFCLCLASPVSSLWGEFRADMSRQGILIQEGGRPVLFYQSAPKSRDGKHTRANYVHPLYDLDGVVISEDFPDDHRHHRGIFWAWHQVRVGTRKLGDAWVCERFDWDTKSTRVKLSADRAIIHSHVNWRSPDWKSKEGNQPAVAEEQVRIDVHAATSAYRLVDFRIQLRPLVENVWIGGSENTKGYGGFSARIRMPKDIKFTGQSGTVTPMINAVEAGPWMNITGTINGKGPGGFAILGHPSSPGHPQPWILRRRGSMQNPRYPGQHAVKLSRQTPLVLRYRLVLHRGNLDAHQINRMQAEWTKVR